jgi:hypothetical protein
MSFRLLSALGFNLSEKLTNNNLCSGGLVQLESMSRHIAALPHNLVLRPPICNLKLVGTEKLM